MEKMQSTIVIPQDVQVQSLHCAEWLLTPGNTEWLKWDEALRVTWIDYWDQRRRGLTPNHIIWPVSPAAEIVTPANSNPNIETTLLGHEDRINRSTSVDRDSTRTWHTNQLTHCHLYGRVSQFWVIPPSHHSIARSPEDTTVIKSVCIWPDLGNGQMLNFVTRLHCIASGHLCCRLLGMGGHERWSHAQIWSRRVQDITCIPSRRPARGESQDSTLWSCGFRHGLGC